ncbi:hypothetical protein R3P38DRAFT_3293798 [Favolaschia claudopus]|uniref:Uncharacterized protein n=1 Tax=Favolaschia claudopus TaxID=2862362 RepID=A0AAV9ZFX4_9AGAR
MLPSRRSYAQVKTNCANGGGAHELLNKNFPVKAEETPYGFARGIQLTNTLACDPCPAAPCARRKLPQVSPIKSILRATFHSVA